MKKGQHYSLDPSEDMREKVLGIVDNEPQGLTRASVISEFKLKFDDHIVDEKALATLIGISLTALHKQKAIGRIGIGVKGNPYVYYHSIKRAVSDAEK